jgi:hypothetical protein
MAKYGRNCATPGPFGMVDIAMADSAGADFDHHLIGLWWINQDIFDDQRLTELVTNGSFHL